VTTDPLVAALVQLVRERHALEQRRRRERQERRRRLTLIGDKQRGKAA
jgi:hypothetical protein